ncbi:hypothetical protein JTE90_019636 [Oedothorax gibbosus]|uniref:Uncharacterized protein n=1 Tax=Oedothorax gibbosus TaxID=931172 RepID=A0AAV6TXJ5_9ARAC|nr:hypothetical protein JTE90_019636 [Oedothorax gibbosus]
MSERKRDYPSAATKRKNKQKREETIKKVPKISSFFQKPAPVSDLDCKVIDALEVISQWEDRDTSSNAHQLLCSIQSSEFLISIQVLNKIFTLSQPLSKFFQEENIDIVNALSYATALETALTVLRENADTEHKKLFAKAEEMATKLEVHIATPRYSKRQTQRCNVPVSNPEEFYRIAM